MGVLHQVWNFYKHHKYFHFFSICFGLGCGLLFYRPFYSTTMPSLLAVFAVFAFECVGVCIGLPPHTRRCKGPPFQRRDALWGFTVALLVTFFYRKCYHVYTLAYGSGITMFTLRGVKRKYSVLWKKWDGDFSY